MNLSHIRLRLTLGYVGIFALILILMGAVAAFGLSVELASQQDDLLVQEARDQTRNLMSDVHQEVLSDGSKEFSWIALDPDGRVIAKDPVAASLGLPDREMIRETLRENDAVLATIRGADGGVRVVSMPMYESGELVGVIQYARSLQDNRKKVNGLILVLLPLGLGALGLAALGGQFMASRAVRPVRESFERQRTFIADASHELKTPLTLIRADTEVLRRGLADPEDRELTDDVLAETDKMNAVLSDLLLMARLDAGQLPVKREAFDAAHLVSRVVDRFAARASAEDTHLEVLPASSKFLALGDPERTEQTLAALVDNALRHTPPGGSVTVSCHARDGFVEIIVKDTGHGILPEQLPNVFERFYRADTARSREGGGTGLGLAIARDLAHAQEGALEAENAKDGGAVFRLRLPEG